MAGIQVRLHGLCNEKMPKLSPKPLAPLTPHPLTRQLPPCLPGHHPNNCTSQGVDIQLTILKTLLSLVTDLPTIHSRLLAFSGPDARLTGCVALFLQVFRRC